MPQISQCSVERRGTDEKMSPSHELRFSPTKPTYLLVKKHFHLSAKRYYLQLHRGKSRTLLVDHNSVLVCLAAWYESAELDNEKVSGTDSCSLKFGKLHIRRSLHGSVKNILKLAQNARLRITAESSNGNRVFFHQLLSSPYGWNLKPRICWVPWNWTYALCYSGKTARSSLLHYTKAPLRSLAVRMKNFCPSNKLQRSSWSK